MSDDLSNRGGSDRARINIHQDHEVRHWAAKLGVTPDELRSAVRAVGDRADRVQDHLNAHKATRGGEDIR